MMFFFYLFLIWNKKYKKNKTWTFPHGIPLIVILTATVPDILKHQFKVTWTQCRISFHFQDFVWFGIAATNKIPPFTTVVISWRSWELPIVFQVFHTLYILLIYILPVSIRWNSAPILTLLIIILKYILLTLTIDTDSFLVCTW